MKKDERLAVIHTHPIQYLAPLYHEVQQRGVSVTAIYGSDFSIAGYEDEEFGTSVSWDVDLLSGYNAHFLDRKKRGGPSAPEETNVKGLWQALNEVEPTAIMLSAYYPWFHSLASLTSALYARKSKRRVRLLLRAETTDHAEHRGGLKQTARDTFLLLFYSLFDHFLYIGERSKNHYQRFNIDSERLSFSPYSVNIDVFQEGESEREEMRDGVRDDFWIEGDTFTILFVGKMSERKGVDVLVKALGGMDAKEEIALMFVGEGPLKEELRHQARQEGVQVHFAGFQNQEDLSRFYHASDTLVLPSRRGETWGLVVNEALHHGIPAIVSDQVGCATDLIESGRTGEVFRSEDPKDLRQAISKVKSEYERAGEHREEVRQFVEAYSIEASAKGILNALRRSERG
ncbi:glycosyltransferase involved in cell wall biosynthesis [Salinibacter ruber]|uniref:glycosyltransferase family 4 protein n=1 Tax=Salinibacter ruber TaxID=146919 RepID=UPI0020732143|nr:glycosyltransferase family 4 protein [Salinibacter ruber]MCS4044989.1 glycosyltransferase involved in cell wall biosynthesis [Salinibacter ruber]